jgi:hypothetical protein
MCKFVIAAAIVRCGMELRENTIIVMILRGYRGLMLIMEDFVNVIKAEAAK